jgi:hypothetical protein
MRHGSSKDRASWEVADFACLFRRRRIRCTKLPRIASAVVEFLGGSAVVVTLLNEQARGPSFVMAGLVPRLEGRKTWMRVIRGQLINCTGVIRGQLIN